MLKNKFAASVPVGSDTQTENGFKAYSSTGNVHLDFFSQIGALRGRPQQALEIFKLSFQEDIETALRLLLWARDIRQGAGERHIFRVIMRYLAENHAPLYVNALLHKVLELGRADDLLSLYGIHQAIDDHILFIIKNELEAENGLVAKWMPRQGKLARNLADKLGMTPREWRKKLVSLTHVVEQKMSANMWHEIAYSKIPSVAMTKYNKALARHDKERFEQFWEDVSQGKEKINTGAVYPYNVLSIQDDMQRDIFWKNLPDFIKSDASFIPMIDCSGSMGTFYDDGNARQISNPINLAITLGIYLAHHNKSAFKNIVLPFSQRPHLIKIDDKFSRSLKIIRNSDDFGLNTDLIAAYRKIIEFALSHHVPPQDMPHYLIVLSDMEIDSVKNSLAENFSEEIQTLFEGTNYTAPRIILWNLESRNQNALARIEHHITLVSGASPNIIEQVLQLKSPIDIMNEIIFKERYFLPLA